MLLCCCYIKVDHVVSSTSAVVFSLEKNNKAETEHIFSELKCKYPIIVPWCLLIMIAIVFCTYFHLNTVRLYFCHCVAGFETMPTKFQKFLMPRDRRCRVTVSLLGNRGGIPRNVIPCPVLHSNPPWRSRELGSWGKKKKKKKGGEPESRLWLVTDTAAAVNTRIRN